MQKNFNDTKQHFSIRKLTIGAASVLIGTTFYLAGGNIVHADAEAANVKNDTQVTNNNEKLAKNDANQAKEVKAASDANVATPTFAPVNVNDWNTQIDGDEFLITGYKGSDTTSNLTIPNSADFEKAGINTNGSQTFANIETVKNLIRNGIAPKLSYTEGQKVALLRRNNSQDEFANSNLTDISGLANADISYVTNMTAMFRSNKISDLTPLSNWDVTNVKYMGYMFHDNQISNLTPLSKWNVANVISMDTMFYKNQISDLTPLSKWNVSNVTNMNYMFGENQISDLAPLSKWNVTNVTKMNDMFFNNQISDLTPLSKWNVSNVTDMFGMFGNNTIKTGDLSKWNMSKAAVTSMIDENSNAVIYLGNNNNLPNGFMDPNNSNIFATSTGNHLIVTSNPTLLANPNNAFNKITFSDGTTANTPVFINAENNNESTLNVVKQAVNEAIATKKTELEKANPDKIVTLTLATDTTDPIALANAKVNITYAPDIQKATINFVDADEDNKVIKSVPLTSTSDSSSTYTTADDIKALEAEGYKVVSDETNGKPITFDHDDQTYTVTLKHGMTGIPDINDVPDDALLSNNYKKSYQSSFDIKYQGNIPNDLKPQDYHQTIDWKWTGDSKGNIAYRDNVNDKITFVGTLSSNNDTVPAMKFADIVAKDGTIYKPYAVSEIATVDPAIGDNSDSSDFSGWAKTKNSDGTITYTGDAQMEPFDELDEQQMVEPINTGLIGQGVVIAYNSTPAKLTVNYVDDKTGDTVDTQTIDGNVGQKITQDNLPVPDGYYLISSKIPDALVDGENIATVTVVKKETSNGDVDTHELATKNIIIYKDKDGNVIGTKDMTGKPGDKVTPALPDGYFNGDITEVTIPENGIVIVNVVKKATSNGDVANTDVLPTKNVIVYKDGNGDVVGTQNIDGKPGDKVTPKIPDGYFSVDATEVTIPENGIVTVNVVKKTTSNGDVANTDVLSTKNVIIYKDGNGDVVGIQEVEGKPGDKVTPKIPDGYFNGDVTEVTIPESGIVIVNVIKKETSNGDPLIQPSLPAYTEPSDNNTDSDVSDNNASEIKNVPNSGNNKSKQGNSNVKIIKRVANNASGSIHTVHNTPNVSSGNKQNTLPQTGEKPNDAVVVGALITSLGALITGLYCGLKKRN